MSKAGWNEVFCLELQPLKVKDSSMKSLPGLTQRLLSLSFAMGVADTALSTP